jgi:hypothetical protein
MKEGYIHQPSHKKSSAEDFSHHGNGIGIVHAGVGTRIVPG